MSFYCHYLKRYFEKMKNLSQSFPLVTLSIYQNVQDKQESFYCLHPNWSSPPHEIVKIDSIILNGEYILVVQLRIIFLPNVNFLSVLMVSLQMLDIDFEKVGVMKEFHNHSGFYNAEEVVDDNHFVENHFLAKLSKAFNFNHPFFSLILFWVFKFLLQLFFCLFLLFLPNFSSYRFIFPSINVVEPFND